MLKQSSVVQFSLVLWPMRLLGGQEGWFSRDLLPVSFVGLHCEEFLHGHHLSWLITWNYTVSNIETVFHSYFTMKFRSELLWTIGSVVHWSKYLLVLLFGGNIKCCLSSLRAFFSLSVFKTFFGCFLLSLIYVWICFLLDTVCCRVLIICHSPCSPFFLPEAVTIFWTHVNSSIAFMVYILLFLPPNHSYYFLNTNWY